MSSTERHGYRCGWAVCLLACGGPAAAQAPQPPQPEPVPWQALLWVQDEALADGLPVLALAHDGWYSGVQPGVSRYRAQRTVQAGWELEQPSGWRWGVLARSQVHLQASPNAVTLAAADAQHTDPPVAAFPDVQVHSMGWRGVGLQLGSPWQTWTAAPSWRWRGHIQWLQLAQVRQNDLSGQVNHGSDGGYDLQLQADRWGEQIRGPFLPSSGQAGWGASLSLALEGEPLPGWQLGLRADDLLSRLHWQTLAAETAVIDSAVSSRTPDGFLDYAPLVQGQQRVAAWRGRMGARWQLAVRHPLPGGVLTWQSSRWQGVQQHWLGWSHEARPTDLSWHVALEPQRRVLAAGVQWHGLSLDVASDGENKRQSQYRRWAVRWQLPW